MERRVRLDDEDFEEVTDVPRKPQLRTAKRVSRRDEWKYVPRPPRREMGRLALMRGLLDEIKFGNNSLSKLYAGLLARTLIEIEPKVAAEFEAED